MRGAAQPGAPVDGEPPRDDAAVAGAAPVALSIVAPVFNEARIVMELVERCTAAGGACGLAFEVVIVDDASTDDTPVQLAGVAGDPRVRACRLAANAGQFRATQAGLRAARGEWVVVLDGDLQDPPEAIPRLVAALSAAPGSVLAVQAVKDARDDPMLMMVGQRWFHRLQHALSGVAVAHGAGSYCIMRRAVAQRVARAGLARANLAAVVAVVVHAVGGRITTIAYAKGPRYDRRGRVGWAGLAAEAVESLAVTGALSRLLGGAAIGLAVAGLAASGSASARALLFAAAAVAAVLALSSRLRARRAVAPDTALRGETR